MNKEVQKIICKCGYSDYLVPSGLFKYVCERCGRIYSTEGNLISDCNTWQSG